MTRLSRFSLLSLLMLVLGTGHALQIGPDGYGYTATDEVPFSWVDISGSGTNLNLSDDNHSYQPLGFNFEFYGTTFSSFAVGSNGTVYFEDAYMGLSNTSIPATTFYTPQSFIAVYWDDLNPGAAGAVYYDVIGSAGDQQLIVSWTGVPHFGGSSTNAVTAQAILYESTGDILLQYLNPSSEAGSGATVGIQDTPNLGLQWSFNQAVLSAEQAICFSAGGTACGTGSVPAPATLALLGMGLAGIGYQRRKLVKAA